MKTTTLKTQGVKISEDEQKDAVERIGELKTKGWALSRIAQAMGFRHAAPLYHFLATPERGLARDRYDTLIALEENDVPAPPAPKMGPQHEVVAADEFPEFERLVETLRTEKGMTWDAIGKTLGYRHPAGLASLLKRKRVRPEMVDALRALSAGERVAMPPRRRAKQKAGPVDEQGYALPVGAHTLSEYLAAATTHVGQARRALREAEKKGVAGVAAPGLREINGVLEQVERQLAVR